MLDFAIGVDIGGTKIATALVSQEGRTIAEDIQPTLPEAGVDELLNRVVLAIQNVCPQDQVISGIGIGCPGPVNIETGISINAVNLGEGWHNIPLHAEIRSRFGSEVPIYIENDVSAGAIGEMVFGAAQGYDDFLFIMLGTGIGGSCIIDRQVISGAIYSAMEIGHVVFRQGGYLCPCGLRGCVEMYASGKGMMTGYQQNRDLFPGSLAKVRPKPLDLSMGM